METLEKPAPTRKRRTITGLTPEQYNHAEFKRRFDTARGLNITKVCEEIGISRMTFYDVVNGRANASRRIVEAIDRSLPPISGSPG